MLGTAKASGDGRGILVSIDMYLLLMTLVGYECNNMRKRPPDAGANARNALDG
jgi:hypothetical protein